MLSIVIPTHNRPDHLERCLAALRSEIGPAEDAEIIVADDGSAPEAQRHVRELCSAFRARAVLLPVNRGMATARNAGYAASSGAWIAFIDDDVRIDQGWYSQALRSIAEAWKQGDIGIEGRVRSSGDGLWDDEVRVDAGGAFLTCHILYRRDALDKAGGFDEEFANRGPFCEDHELAARLLRLGSIRFDAALSATHSARHVRLLDYCGSSARRMRHTLNAEFYFYLKHRDRYHQFRHARSFWGTYVDILLKYAVTSFRRRSGAAVLRHPVQAMALAAAMLLEQLTAWILLPRFIFAWIRQRPATDIQGIDAPRTALLWKTEANLVSRMFFLRTNQVRSLLFPLRRKPVYDLVPSLRRIRQFTGCASLRFLLRVDDVFFDHPDRIRDLCTALRKRNLPFLAAVTGNDIIDTRGRMLLEQIAAARGIIGLHGFAHSGKFGPFASEILQMTFSDLDRRCDEIISRLSTMNIGAPAFVAPFNALCWEQIVHLAQRFAVVCGGPETARFANALCGPLAIATRSWYVPSFFPFYQSARDQLRCGALDRIGSLGGYAALTLHLEQEAADGFSSMAGLLDRIGDRIVSWEELC
jgi:glycosyltransferase involved in cell wall biosynthesis